MKIEVTPPVKIGDKIWMSKNSGFGTCNSLERYTQYEEVTVCNVRLEYDTKTGESKWFYGVEGRGNLYLCDNNYKIYHTKEELYESFREEIEKLIPEDLRNYLWNTKD